MKRTTLRFIFSLILIWLSATLFAQTFVQIGLPNTIGLVKKYPGPRIYKTGLMAQLGYEFYEGKLSLGLVVMLEPDLFYNNENNIIGGGITTKIRVFRTEKWKIHSVTDILSFDHTFLPGLTRSSLDRKFQAVCSGLNIERILTETWSTSVSATLGLFRQESNSIYGIQHGWYSSQPISLSMFYYF